MRQIKFRAWNNKYKFMVYPEYGYWVSFDGITYDEADHKGDTSNIEVQKSKDLSPLMQFTGLLDKNGKEIYEGDIVKWGHLPGSEETPIRIAEVKIDPDIQFDCKNIPSPHIFHYGSFAYSAVQLEVIGNLYENPELLTPKH